jgi:cell division protein FtsW (lipid II flippase)
MFAIPDEFGTLINLVFLAITGVVAYNGVRYRDAEGNTDFVRLLFGCIAAMFFFLVLFRDVLNLFSFA